MKELSNLLPNLNETERDELLQRLVSAAQEKFKKEKLSDYYSWTKAIWTTGKGNPLDFSKRPSLRAIYQDQHHSIVYMKSAQAGISERLISEAVWLADQKGLNTLYTFPTQSHLQDFVQARLNPVLSNSEYLSSKIESETEKKVEKLGLKRIGKGHIYFRGSQNEKQIITVDSDMIILDERDRFDEDHVPFIEKRLLASQLKWRRDASTPTLPGMGIHAAYMASDQRVWQIQCPKCTEWQELDFFKNVDFKKKCVRCHKCRKKLDRLSDGRWLITNPKSDVHGYKINGLYNPNVLIKYFIERYRKAQVTGYSALQQFFNQDLGLTYEVVGQRLQLTELNGCKRDFFFPIDTKKDCYAGIDVGVKCHHAIVLERKNGHLPRLAWAGTVKDFLGPHDSIQTIMDRFNITRLVIDKKPEQTKVRELMTAFPRRVYAAEYPNMNFSVQEYFLWDDIKYEVKLDRTISLDYLIADIQNQKIELPKNIEIVEGFYDQLRAATRITEKNPRTGVETSRWVEKGADHFLHAFNYARLAQISEQKGKALLDYYVNPERGLTPSFIDWIRVKGERIF